MLILQIGRIISVMLKNTAIIRKRGGRPSLFDERGRARIYHLYYGELLTARDIQKLLEPDYGTVALDTIRSVARRYAASLNDNPERGW